MNTVKEGTTIEIQADIQMWKDGVLTQHDQEKGAAVIQILALDKEAKQCQASLAGEFSGESLTIMLQNATDAVVGALAKSGVPPHVLIGLIAEVGSNSLSNVITKSMLGDDE